jgi:hypothetical protein
MKKQDKMAHPKFHSSWIQRCKNAEKAPIKQSLILKKIYAHKAETTKLINKIINYILDLDE